MVYNTTFRKLDVVILSSNSLESGRWTKSENPLSLCLPGKPTVAQPPRHSQHFTELEGSLPCSQELSRSQRKRVHTQTPYFFDLNIFFLIGIVEGGVQLGPLGTSAIDRPILPAPGAYDGGEIGGMIGRGNRSTRRKPDPVPLCPPQTPHAARTRTRAAAVGSQRLTT
jgi:hypothetical protein